MVLNYITIFSLEANRSNECLLGERKLALWLLWEEASFGGKKFCAVGCVKQEICSTKVRTAAYAKWERLQ